MNRRGFVWCGALAVIPALPLVSLAGAEPASDPAAAAFPVVGSYRICDVNVPITDAGLVGTLLDPSAEFHVLAGLWVGARADRDEGPEVSVSTAAYEFEFVPASDDSRPPSGDRPDLRIVYRDTGNPWYPDHVPLGIEVVQESRVVDTPRGDAFIDVRYTVTNISGELSPPGWVLENVYFGVFADADVGAGDHAFTDDLGTFVPAPPASPRPGVGWVFDEPGGGDDVSVRAGIALLDRPVHAFRIWSSGAVDPSDDDGRYALLRGTSDEVPTIDPDPTRSADQRILLSCGPIARIDPGESRSFRAALVCGEDGGALPDSRIEPPEASDIVARAGAPVILPASEGEVEIFTAAGRRVAVLSPGASWESAAGVYFYRTKDARAMRGKIVVLR
jgi:hypothetical protein